MADSLSQDQIDAMLQAAISGGAEAALQVVGSGKDNEPREYDFKSPKKFTKERMKTLRNIFDGYTRLLSTYVTGKLRMYCKVSLVSVEEQKYSDFNNALPDYVMMGMGSLILNDEDVEDMTVIVQLQNELTYSIIDRLLGGRGSSKDEDRDFTEIEVSIMSGVMKDLIEFLKDPWDTLVENQPRFITVETNSRVVSAIGYDDAMIVAVMEVLVGDGVKTLITVCIPALDLDEVMTKFTKRTIKTKHKSNETRDMERQANIKDSIVNSLLPVTAILGDVKLDMFDVINLAPGDIIPLEKPIDSNIVVRVGGTKWYDGKLGTHNSHKAVRIVNILNGPDTLD